MSELCTYLLNFSTTKFNIFSSKFNETYYSSLLNNEDVNVICDIYGNTPLHLAWMSGYSYLITELLEKDALYSRNDIKCFPNELGLFPEQMAIIVDRLWRVEILDSEGIQKIQNATNIRATHDPVFSKNLTVSAQENIWPYRTFFSRHYHSHNDNCDCNYNITSKMMSGQIDCDWFANTDS